MKPQIKSIHALYSRFIRGTEFDGKIEPQDLAIILHLNGKIDLLGHRDRATIEHYKPTIEFNELSYENQFDLVQRIMASMIGGAE
jgi:hypothetical protein